MMKLAAMVLMVLVPFVGTAQDLQVPLNLTDGRNAVTLTFGVAAAALDGFDALDRPSPPPPPSGAFDARFLIDVDDLLTDLRGNSSGSKRFVVSYALGTNQSALTVTWDTTVLRGRGTFKIVDDLTGMQFGPVDMTKTDSITLSDPSVSGINKRFRIEVRYGLDTEAASDAGREEKLTIETVYPNPVRASATIVAYIPGSNRTLRLSVYDVLGRPVVVLPPTNFGTGMQQIHLDTSHLPTGVYRIALTGASGAVSTSLVITG